MMMSTSEPLTASSARARLHGPVQIVGRRHSAVLVSMDEWNAICETLHIASQPGVMHKIRNSEGEDRAAMKTLDEID